MSSEAADPVAWLRKQVEADLAAARIINAGGFSPQRWDTEPPGQVNPVDIPQSDAVTTALGCPPEYICGWVQIVAYDKLNIEPDEAYGRDSEAPVALVDNGRREVDHIIRHDPRNVVADCEAKLAILDEHRLVVADSGQPEQGQSRGREYRIVHEHPTEQQIQNANMMWHDLHCRACRVRPPCSTVRILLSAYKHREGYQETWLT